MIVYWPGGIYLYQKIKSYSHQLIVYNVESEIENIAFCLKENV